MVIQAVGGLVLGSLAALAVLRALRGMDDFMVEVSLSLALAMGVFAGAQALHLSGPIAVVAAGLLIGDRGSHGATSETTQAYLRSFWTLVDEILNALLFFLLGLQLLVLPRDTGLLGLCAAATGLVLLSRFVVVLPWGRYLHLRLEERYPSVILAWGGLHGALSLALALSIPDGPQRPAILAATYAVATVSVALQGLTFGPVAAALARRSPDA